MWKGICRALEEAVEETQGQSAKGVKRLLELHSQIVESLLAGEEAHKRS